MQPEADPAQRLAQVEKEGYRVSYPRPGMSTARRSAMDISLSSAIDRTPIQSPPGRLKPRLMPASGR
ncbi:hypothetical protein GCM10029963_45860 [Micromonospora andamanensis]